VKRAIPSRLRRRWLSAWGTLLARLLAMAGMALTTGLAASAHRGPICLAFLTIAAILAIAVARARREVRRAGTALRLHRKVEEALAVLASRGWHLKHNVRWPEGPGDGHLAMIPAGDLAFAIKDCIGGADDFDLTQTQAFATALSQTGRPYVPICVASAGSSRSLTDRGVVGCTPERLAAELLDAEEAFGASLHDEELQQQLLYSPAGA
jgi:hypothetical protein